MSVLDTHIWFWFINQEIATALLYDEQLASIDGVFSQYPELENSLMK